jgi:hypothetical protein
MLRPAALAATASWLCLASFAQSAAETKVTVYFNEQRFTIGGQTTVIPGGLAFECRGTPTCTYVPTELTPVELSSIPGCENTPTQYVKVGVTMTGLNLSQSGAISGNIVYTDAPSPGSFANGVCTFGRENLTYPYTGTWSTASNTGTLAIGKPQCSFCADLPLEPFTGTFKAEITAPPVFPMTVTSSIDSRSATASAVIGFRPQDVGTSGSVFVFAVAPADVVRSAASGTAFAVGKAVSKADGKDTSVACVLAQLNASGQLQAVSSSSLQAYVTGVLSAQGQSVTIMNGVPTVNVGGATFYIGYGSSSTSMINSGVNRSAVTVPGTKVCKPQPPQKGWWWNDREPGRGFSIEVQGNNLFMATYLYDVSGRATWHVATGPTSLDGSVFSGQLLTFGNGVTMSGPYRPNARLADAGPVTLTFDNADSGTLVWPGGTVAIRRFGFGASGAATAPLSNQPETGWWWGGAGDNGRGFFIEWQGNKAFLAGYMYDGAGNPVWYVADVPVTNAQAINGGSWLEFANGQTLTGAFRTPTLTNPGVAPVAIQFQGAENAILTLPSGTIPISRFRFY